MNDNEQSRNETDRNDSVSARNIEHLLSGAYAPEVFGPAACPASVRLIARG